MHFRIAFLASSIAGATFWLPLPALAQSCAGGAIPCLQPLGNLPGAENLSNRFSTATAISADGNVVVGYARNANGQQEGFRWTNGVMQGLGRLPDPYGVCNLGADCSQPKAVNADGSIVVGDGYSQEPGASTPFPRPFVWSAGTMTQIVPSCSPSHSNDFGEALGINAAGNVIVGYFACALAGNNLQAFRQVNGTFGPLGFLPSHNRSAANGVSADGNVVVGWSDNREQSGTQRAFRWAGSMTDLGALPGETSVANAISGDGSTIVGQSGNKPVRWAAGRITDLDGLSGEALDTNFDGSVILTPLPWTARTGPRPPNFTVHVTSLGVDVSQWTNIGTPQAVSADGRTFAGTGVDAEGRQQAWIMRLPLPPTAHDFDGSAKSDILWRDTSGNLVMWLMNGSAVAGNSGLGLVDSNWQIAGQRDFDGDGKYDILWRHSSGATAIWLMNGATVKSVASFGTIPPEWSVVGTRDLNGDGKGDILWRDTSGATAVWLMNGATLISNTVIGTVPPPWSIVTTNDFNADGKADILWRDTSGNTYIWFMDGASVTSTAAVATVPPPWEVIAAADFDGDGRADLLWRDTSGNTAMWLMEGASVAMSAGIGNISPPWFVAETGDYNGDGRADILWRDTSGNTYIWFMNGTAVASSSFVANVPNMWTVEAKNAD